MNNHTVPRMVRIRLRTVLAAMVLLGLSPWNAADAQVPIAAPVATEEELPSGEEVLARYVEAIGGEEAIRTHRFSMMKMRFKGPRAEADIYHYRATPDRMLRLVRQDDGKVWTRMGLNGDIGWSEIDVDLGPRVLKGRELARLKEEADPRFFALLDPTAFTALETLGVEQMEGADCYKVRIVTPTGDERFDYFDTQTGLRVASETRSVNGSYVVEKVYVSDDYQDFGGIKLSTKGTIRYKKWPLVQTLTTESVAFEAIPDSMFEVPDGILADPWPYADNVTALLQIEPGLVVADVGAGSGVWALEIARRVGPDGHVLATEIDPLLVGEIHATVAYEGLTNLTPILSDQNFTGLPPACCDRILLRFVYHEFDDPEAMSAGLLRALRPGGLLAVIDDAALPENELENGRGSHTILPDVLVQELTDAGFEVVSRDDGGFNGYSRRLAMTFRRAE